MVRGQQDSDTGPLGDGTEEVLEGLQLERETLGAKAGGNLFLRVPIFWVSTRYLLPFPCFILTEASAANEEVKVPNGNAGRVCGPHLV